MKCICCKRKLAMINCKGCKGIFCSGCILMEEHACTGMEAVKTAEREKLAKSMPVVCASKISKL